MIQARSPLLICWLTLALCACGGDDKPPKDDTSAGGNDGFVFNPTDTGGGGGGDSGGTSDTATSADGAGTTDAATDTGTPTGTVVGVELSAEKSALGIAERALLTVTVVRSSGAKGPPGPDETVSFEVDGQAQKGAGVAAAGQPQPAAVVWTFGGTRQLVGARPGTAKVVAKIGTQSSPALEVQVGWPATQGVIARTAEATGTTAAERKADLDDTIQLYGQTKGAGGLTATLRFPEGAAPGTRLPLETPPAKGQLSLTLAFADLGGASLKPAEGALWIDQTDKGLFRGTFLGRTTSLKPIAGTFTVERKGLFGIDLLDEPTELAKSDNPQPLTGKHYSRASLVALGGGKARLYARRIDNGLKAHLVAWDIDAKSGKATEATPLVSDANAYDTVPTTPAPAFGAVRRASHAGVTCELWEGRDGKGATKPHRLWVRLVDDKGALLAGPAVVSDDVCDGGCQPELRLLPSTRFLVVWSLPGGKGVKVRRIKGQPDQGQVAFDGATPLVAAPGGKDAVVAVHGANVLLGWFDPDVGHVWRHYTDKPGGNLSALAPKQPIGVASTKAPRQGLVALTTPSAAPNLLFVSTWIDYAPGAKLALRRVGLDGTALGLPLPLGDIDADAIWTAPGKSGQVLLLTRSPKGKLVARKATFASFKDTGKLLGEPATLLPETGAAYTATPTMVYVPEADTWIVAWAGDDKSPGILVRRLR